MPAPAALDLGPGDEGADHELEQGAGDGQRQPGAGLAVGRLGEGAAGLEGDVRPGRIAMGDLDDEPGDDSEWGQEGIAAPAVLELLAAVADGRVVDLGAEALPETAHCHLHRFRDRGPPASRVA
jgi:hypothetical protein